MSSTMFSPQRCAELHNLLVAYAVEANSDLAPHITRNAFTPPAAPTTHPEDSNTPIRSYLSVDIILFLESIDTWEDSSSPFSNVAPFAHPPTLHRFWDFDEYLPADQYQNAVLLYGDSESSNAGGLFFDMDTSLVYWQLIPGFQWPKPEDWIPLEVALTRWLKMWETGKVQKLGHGYMGLQKWCAWELERDLKAWDNLLHAIEGKMPDRSNNSDVKIGLVDPTILGQWPANSFTREFLAMARMPRRAGLLVAPGIGTFTTSSYHNLHLSEGRDSQRLHTISSRNLQQEDLIPSLLFPSATTVDTSVDYFGNFLLQGRAGLYIVPDMGWGDAVTVVNGEGNREAFEHTPRRCPWGPGRGAVLAEVLQRWTELIEDGTWGVDENGVTGGIEMLNEAHPSLCLKWDAKSEF
ncbi:hypothetical protein MMC30_009250 [Trapelia coarctata]|nr:hypothetical protein [Trapelia coarctata]